MEWTTLSRLFLRRRISHQRHSASGQRRDGTAVSEPVRQTAGRRTVLVDRERALGLLQPRRSDICWSAASAISICAPSMTSIAFGIGHSSVRPRRRRACSAAFTAATPLSKDERSFEGHVPFAGRLQLPGLGRRARSCPMSGTWMQRTAQDWIVLTQLTHRQRDRGRHRDGAAVRAANPAAAADRFCRRSSRPPQAAVLHAGGDGLAGARPWPSHRHRTGPAVARLCFRVSARLRHRIRCAGAADLRRRTGRRDAIFRTRWR